LECTNPARRRFLGSAVGVAAAAALGRCRMSADQRNDGKPNILFVMTDQQRFDTIAALGNEHIYTPNLDRLVKRGIAFTRAYSTCPVCVPARYTIRTGCEPPTTGIYDNGRPSLVDGQSENMEDRCGRYLARTLADLGYRTFGIGKFHTQPWNEDLGFEVNLHCQELYASPEHRAQDDYAAFIAREHPEFDYLEGLMGERTEMYYIPQRRPMPADIAAEAWTADRAVELIRKTDGRPYFGFVSMVGPHPPIAPPQPYHRMYDPDRMPNPVSGDIAVDHMDEMIPWMNYAIWAEDINDAHARILKARYYGTISYIDQCIGRILEAVETGPDPDNTLICFFSDHGDHLGDHNAWQKESFFEQSCHVLFLVSWPKKLPKNVKRDELVCLTDLFGIATSAAGRLEPREGIDVLSMIEGRSNPRERLIGYYGTPGTRSFKMMVREGDWKYIFMANGGREQLFNLADDPMELKNRAQDAPHTTARLRDAARQAASRTNVNRALESGKLRSFDYRPMERRRIYQFDASRGAVGFPERPQDVLKGTT